MPSGNIHYRSLFEKEIITNGKTLDVSNKKFKNKDLGLEKVPITKIRGRQKAIIMNLVE